ncbi:unnamed protein product, partial [Prorocentrum cordatum]
RSPRPHPKTAARTNPRVRRLRAAGSRRRLCRGGGAAGRGALCAAQALRRRCQRAGQPPDAAGGPLGGHHLRAQRADARPGAARPVPPGAGRAGPGPGLRERGDGGHDAGRGLGQRHGRGRGPGGQSASRTAKFAGAGWRLPLCAVRRGALLLAGRRCVRLPGRVGEREQGLRRRLRRLLTGSGNRPVAAIPGAAEGQWCCGVQSWRARNAGDVFCFRQGSRMRADDAGQFHDVREPADAAKRCWRESAIGSQGARRMDQTERVRGPWGVLKLSAAHYAARLCNRAPACCALLGTETALLPVHKIWLSPSRLVGECSGPLNLEPLGCLVKSSAVLVSRFPVVSVVSAPRMPKSIWPVQLQAAETHVASCSLHKLPALCNPQVAIYSAHSVSAIYALPSTVPGGGCPMVDLNHGWCRVAAALLVLAPYWHQRENGRLRNARNTRDHRAPKHRVPARNMPLCASAVRGVVTARRSTSRRGVRRSDLALVTWTPEPLAQRWCPALQKECSATEMCHPFSRRLSLMGG